MSLPFARSVGRAMALGLGLLLPSLAAAGPTLVLDAGSGKVLYSEEPDQSWFPASLTKIMTAYVVFDAIKAGKVKLDTPVPPPDGDLDVFYRGRRWLTAWLDHPDHQLRFRLEPGDALVMDNRRVLHGRTAFDPSAGVRHLQGAYIDHDGPDTLYRLAVRHHLASHEPGGNR